MVTKKRTWSNPPKNIKHAEEGHCKICHKDVKNLPAHMKTKHKGAKDA